MGQAGMGRGYGEWRMFGYAPMGTLVRCVVFMDPGNKRRVVGFRKAKAREVRYYASLISVGADIGSADT